MNVLSTYGLYIQFSCFSPKLRRISTRFLTLLMLFGYGCTEVYNPELDSGNNILYVEGGVSDVPGPHKVILRYTADYNDKPEFIPAVNASVRLVEEGTEVTRFIEEEDGVYLTDSLFSATIGKSYVLFVETQDGHVYESVPQVIPGYNMSIDSVYGYKEIRKVKYYNVFGDLVVFDEQVNQIYADIASSTENTYYRFESQLTLEHAAGMRAYVSWAQYDPVDLYVWDSFYPDDLSVIEVNATRDKVRKFPLTHALENNESYSQLKYKYLPSIQAQYDQRIFDIVQVEVETDTGIVMMDSVIYGIGISIAEGDYYYGWILQIQQLSITPEAYTFWTDIKKLEETEGEIFDPITTQLRGNMICTSDEERPVLGLFEVASRRETRAFVNYISNDGIYPGKLVYDLPDFPDNGWNDTVPPDFWVDKVLTNGKAMDLIKILEK